MLFATLGAIKRSAENGMASAINDEIDKALNSALASLPVDFKVGTTADIDLSLVAPEVYIYIKSCFFPKYNCRYLVQTI